MIDAADYSVVFDLVDQGYRPNWLSIAAGVVTALVCARLALSGRGGNRRILPALVAVIAVLGTTWKSWDYWSEYRYLRQATLDGRYELLEGRVENFRSDPFGGNTPQRFSVSNRSVVIHGATSHPGFHRTFAFGGPDFSDRCVRLAIVESPDLAEDRIVWVGIKDAQHCV